MLSLHSRLGRKDDEIVAKVMDGEAVIINLSNGMYYSLEQVGGAIWEMIEEGYRLDEIVAAIVARFEVSPAQAQDDALRLAAELIHHELIVIAEPEREEPPRRQDARGPGKLPYAAPQLGAYSDMEELLALDPPTPGFADLPWKE